MHLRRLLHWTRFRNPLTGLFSKVSFRQDITDELTQVAAGPSCTVVAIDLDNFKSINDTLGHAGGDDVLKRFAAALAEAAAPHGAAYHLFTGDDLELMLSAAATPAT